MNATMDLDKTYVAPTYARFPVELVAGHGATLVDDNGKEYIDMGSGIGVNAFGVADPIWQEAVIAQIRALPHTSNLYYTAPCARLAQMLCERTGLSRVFFGNSGAEANECAIKVARKYAHDKYGDDHYTIITLKNSFHGRTIATLAATGQDVFHEDFAPFPGGFVYATPNDLNSVRAFAEARPCAAVLLEVVQGEGGVEALDADFLKGVEALCHEKDMLFMVDEVQSGNGRSGALYAYMRYGLKPDVVTTAKGLGGGLPIGACIIGEKAAQTLSAGKHGSTFGGNPVVCAGAISLLNRIDDNFLAEVRGKAALIHDALTGAKGVVRLSGLGLMIGIEVEGDAKALVRAMMEAGVLPLTAKNKIRLLPPLTISVPELTKALDIMKEVLAK